jgi:hypothetical protein
MHAVHTAGRGLAMHRWSVAAALFVRARADIYHRGSQPARASVGRQAGQQPLTTRRRARIAPAIPGLAPTGRRQLRRPRALV